MVERSLAQVLNAPLPENLERELIIVDDCSTDGTSEILDRLAAEEPCIRLFRKKVNEGKGAAVRTAIREAQGDFCLVQDADLEYDPSEYPTLLRPLLSGHADAVFGSRYLVREQTRILPFWHSMINKTLTLLSNMFCNLNLTDMETCYKVFRTDLLKSIPIRSDRFGFEPEITMKCAKRKLRIYEVPISYHGRTYEEGKKIGWKDGVKALGVIFRFWLIDDLYTEPYGRAFLNNLTGTPFFQTLGGEISALDQLIANYNTTAAPANQIPLIVLAPQSQALFGTLDQALGHRRRFSQEQLRSLFEQNGFAVQSMQQLNKIGAVGWWLFGNVLRRKRISKVMLKIFDKTVWFWRHFDGILPWPGLTLVAVATKQAD